MKTRLLAWIRNDRFFSPRGFLLRAALLAAFLGILHLLGLRESASVLCGTYPEGAGIPELGAFLGLLYVLVYLGFAVAAPIFVLAAGFLRLLTPAARKQDTHGD